MGEIVALLQLNPTVGDIESNAAEIERAAALAASNGASIACTCELAVCGYPPRDLLLDDGFVERCQAAASAIQSPIPLLVGTPIDSGSERTKPANGAVRAMLQDVAAQRDMRFVAPPLWLCTDNAAMMGWAGAERFAAGLTDPLDIPARPRWPLDDQAGTIPGLVVTRAGTAVAKLAKDVQGLMDNRVGLLPVHVTDKAYATGIVLIPRVVEALGLRGNPRFDAFRFAHHTLPVSAKKLILDTRRLS